MPWVTGGIAAVGALSGILGGSSKSKAPPYTPVPKAPIFTAQMPGPSGIFADMAAKPSGLKPEDYLTYGQVSQDAQGKTKSGVPSAAFFDYVKTPEQQQAATPHWQTYLDQNPDVTDGYKIALMRNDPILAQNKITDPLKYAQWHYQTYGAGEGRAPPKGLGGADWSPGDTGDLRAKFAEAHPEASWDLAAKPDTSNIAVNFAGGGYAVKGPGTGRSDSVPANLSNGEYVVDAESVGLLGDGSNDAGAKRLDDMRVNIRKAKGKALAKGKFSAPARAPEQYMVRR